jgi:hypothetical protein
VAQERLSLLPDGRVLLSLARPWSDGTHTIVFTPRELLESLAAMTPRPRINLIIYHGVFAGHARNRPSPTTRCVAAATSGTPEDASPPARPKRRSWRWAELMSRVFAIDVLACPRCGGRLRLLATIAHPEAIRRILAHLGLPTTLPQPLPARSPPEPHAALSQDSLT